MILHQKNLPDVTWVAHFKNRIPCRIMLIGIVGQKADERTKRGVEVDRLDNSVLLALRILVDLALVTRAKVLELDAILRVESFTKDRYQSCERIAYNHQLKM